MSSEFAMEKDLSLFHEVIFVVKSFGMESESLRILVNKNNNKRLIY